ncbi:hypothetical protein [Sphingobium sp. CR28]|uniref:hypothetical protein n=1 Tax=Sphingobium sp. CR28 TaxID=3400272 RepID=UPI003FF10481
MPRPLPRTVFRIAALLLAAGGFQAHAQAPVRADAHNGDAQPPQTEAAPVTPSYALTEDEKAGRRTIDVAVYGDDACPTTDDGTIIVCARRPEAERFRIPPAVRKKEAEEKDAPAEQGWGSRAMATEASGRAFLPNSCSPIGSNGSTGCTQAMLQQWYAEMRKAGKLGPIFGK